MGDLHESLDNILHFLSQNPNSEFRIDAVLKKLNLPVEMGMIRSAVNNLEKFNHIEVKDNRYSLPFITITPAGKEFINRSSYKEMQHTDTMPLDYFMYGKSSMVEVSKEDKESLETVYLQLQINTLQNQLSDYTVDKARANTSHTISIITAIASAVAVIISFIALL